MFDEDLLVPLVTDVAYGILLLGGIISYTITGQSFSIGLTIGAALGYAIHTAAHMLGYSVNTELVDDHE